MEKISLGFAMPVYNEEDSLRNTLDNIFNQLPSINDKCDLKIYIADNCSTDSTAEICREYQEKYGDIIIYKRNSENVGPLKNLDVAADMVQSEYFWFFGDDGLYPDAISYLVNIINDNPQAQSLVAMANIYDEDDAALNLICSNIAQTNNGNVIISEKLKTFLTYSLGRPYFLSNAIFKTSAWKKYNTGCDSTYPHTKVLFRIAANEKTIIIDRPLVKGRTSDWHKSRSAEYCFQVAYDCLELYLDIAPKGRKKHFPQFYQGMVTLTDITNFFWKKIDKPKQLEVMNYFIAKNVFIYEPERWLLWLALKINFKFAKRIFKIITNSQVRYMRKQNPSRITHRLLYIYWGALDFIFINLLGIRKFIFSF